MPGREPDPDLPDGATVSSAVLEERPTRRRPRLSVAHGRPPRVDGRAALSDVLATTVAVEGEHEAERRVARAFAGGEESALEEAWERWSGQVHGIAVRALGNRADADEVTQTVFVEAWRGRDRYDPGRGALPAWLVTIAKRRAIDAHRRRARRPVPTETVPEAGPVAALPSAEPAIERTADRMLLADALQRLPDERRHVVALAFFNDMTHTEIADRTGIPLGTVKSHLRRGLRALHDELASTTGTATTRPTGGGRP